MRDFLQHIIITSRPRFWSYLAGPFLIGFVATIPTKISLVNSTFFLLLIFFIFPANVILYGINDLYDTDTDQYNSKKADREIILQNHHRSLNIMGILVSGVFLLLSLLLINNLLTILIGIWLLLSVAYSATPLRLKARPIYDSLSNVLYIIPGLVGYAIMSNTLARSPFIISAGLWAISMHLFSAIPDIIADKKAGLKTTAVVLGTQKSLITCAILWTSSILLAGAFSWWWIALIGAIYPILAVVPLIDKELTTRVYWWFPYINFIIGFVLFLAIFLPKPYV